MAKKIRDEVLKYTIEINGNKAQQELLGIEKAQRKLSAQNKDLRAEKVRLKSLNKQGSEEWKRVTQALRENNTEMKANAARMKELRGEIGLTAMTPAQLRKEANRLRLALNNMIPGSLDAKRYEAQLQAVNARLGELRVKGKAAGFSIRRLAGNMNHYAAMGATVVATVAGLVVSFQRLIDFNSKLADAEADVVKTTGLTDDEIKKLTASLGVLKTRSARIELLALAEEAGRLGKKGVPEIMSFVETAEKIKIALGDDLQGDVNDNIRVIGKMTEQYRIGAEFGAEFGLGMEMLGSAINEVAQSGTNQAGFLVDILKRMVGVASQADITADKIIGLAAAADEAGQSQEITATALNRTIVDMMTDPAEFAKIAGVSIGEFESLLRDDAYEALLLFLEGIRGNDKGLQGMAKRFDDAGINGTRAIQVLAALSNNTDKIRERQDLANKSMQEGTSLAEEAEKKNNNFAGTLDKLRKRLMGLVTDNPLTEWLKASITWFAKFVGAIEDSDGSVTAFRERLVMLGKILIVGATALISYKGALFLVANWSRVAAAETALLTIASKAQAVITNGLKAATMLYAGAVALASGNIVRATAAMRVFNAVSRLNPLGLLAAGVGAVAGAYLVYSDRVEQASAAEQVRGEISERVAKATIDERVQLQKLLDVAKDNNNSKAARIEAINELRKLAPEYLGDLSLEEIGYKKSEQAINDYIHSLDRKAKAEAINDLRGNLHENLIRAQLTDARDFMNAGERMIGQYTQRVSNGFWRMFGIVTDDGMGQQSKDLAIKAIQQQIQELERMEDEMHDFAHFADKWASERAASEAARLEEIKAKLIKEAEAAAKLSEKRKEAEKEIQDFLSSQNQTEVNRLKSKFTKLLQLADKYKIDRLALERELQKQLQALELEQAISEGQEADESQVSLMESSMQQLWEYEKAQLISQDEWKRMNKEQQHLALEQLEREHLMRLLEARKALNLDTLDVEMKLGAAKDDQKSKELDEEKKAQRLIRRMAVATANVRVQEGENAMNAIIQQIKHQIKAYIAEAIAAAIGMEFKTKGLLGAVTGAAAAGLVGVMMDRLVPSFGQGKYDVLDQHGDRYKATGNERMPTGIYRRPTVSFSKNQLVAERGPELIVDAPTTRRLMQLHPEVLDIINRERHGVRGYAQGKYPAEMDQPSTSSTQAQVSAEAYLEAARELSRTLQRIQRDGIPAYLPDATRRAANELSDLEATIYRQSKILR